MTNSKYQRVALSEKPSLSVFVPCYNEEANVADTTKQILQVLETLDCDYEFIIVNDGSADRTGEIADRLASENSHVRAVHHPKNLGYGAALQSGFKAAEKELVFYTDGDGQFDINELPPLLPLIRDCDIVSCFRIKRRDPLMRKLNAFAWTTLVGLLFRLKIKDVDCAFKLYRRDIFDHFTLSSTGALIDTEVLAKAVRIGCKITQKGVHHLPRRAGEQTGAKISVIFRAFKELFRLYLRIKKEIHI